MIGPTSLVSAGAGWKVVVFDQGEFKTILSACALLQVWYGVFGKPPSCAGIETQVAIISITVKKNIFRMTFDLMLLLTGPFTTLESYSK